MNTTTVLSLLGCLVLIPSLNANLVTNGDFEEPPIADQATGFQTYLGGQSFAGWTVGGNSIDVVGDNPASWVWWNAASGHQSVDLNGTAAGWIYQDLHTVVGEEYDLSFALAGNAASGPPVVRMEFLWEGNVVDTLSFDVKLNRIDPGWTYLSYVLTALSDQARLTFESLIPFGTEGAAIDDVGLNPIHHLVPDSAGPWTLAGIFLPIAVRAVRSMRRARVIW